MKNGVQFINGHKWVDTWYNGKKIAGSIPITKSGDGSVEFDKCYDDVADVVVKGKTETRCDWWGKEGLYSQDGIPTPQTPVPIISNLPAGTYKVQDYLGDWYEFTLTDDLGGIGDVMDMIAWDKYGRIGWRRNKVGKKVFNGTENWTVYTSIANHYQIIVGDNAFGSFTNNIISTHFIADKVNGAYYSSLNYAVMSVDGSRIRFKDIDISDVTTWKSLLVAQNSVGTPLTVMYQLSTPTQTALTFTKNNTSSAPELPMEFITDVASEEYPATTKQVGVYNSVTGVYDFTVESQGKNLFDITAYNKMILGYNGQDITSKMIKDGNIIANQYDLWNGGAYFIPDKQYVLSAGQYTLNGKTKDGENVNIWAGVRYTDNTRNVVNVAVTSTGDWVDFSYTFTIAETKIVRGVYLQNNGTKAVSNIKFTNIQLEKGIATPYEPYHSNIVTFSLPHSMGILNNVTDEYHVNTGVDTKRCSDWISLDGGKYMQLLSNRIGFKRLNISPVFDTPFGSNVNLISYKYNGKLLSYGNTFAVADVVQGVGTDIGLRISVKNEDSGWSNAYVPSQAEIKAYFYGWKMCNSDGMSPYYKSEVPYTPATWAEWTKTNATIDSNNNICLNNTPTTRSNMNINMSLKPLKTSTKYVFTYEVVSNTTSIGYYACINDNVSAYIGSINRSVGKHKYIVTTPSTFTYFYISISDSGYGTTSGSFVLKNIQLFEAPTGSQIESDFNALTADQFSIKYPFYDLNPPHWKRIVDGAGLTSTLPTASYVGYTPYKMMYELAEPIVTEYAPQYPKTFYPTTTIEACKDSEIKPTVEVMARQFGI